MAQFSRRTVLAATDLVPTWNSHAQVDRFVLEHGLEDQVNGGSLIEKALAIGRHLVRNPEAQNEDGENLTDVIVGQLVAYAVRMCIHGYPREFNLETFRNNYPELLRGLARDGFSVEGGELRRALPEALDLPRADDEVHMLLDRYGFLTSRGHLGSRYRGTCAWRLGCGESAVPFIRRESL